MIPGPDDEFDNGWDVAATLVDGRWVDRTPRWPDREPQLRREATLLPWLAPMLPLPVPLPVIVSEEPLTVRHAYIAGGPCPGTSAAHGAAIGEFLKVLHAVDQDEALRHGARDASSSHAELQEILVRMHRDVLPLLPGKVASAGRALLVRMTNPPPKTSVIHGDLGPQHIRVVGQRIGGVIDWGDSCIGDPALDLAWTVLGSAPAFSAALVAAYRPDDALVSRARDWRQLGPWHEVLHGLHAGGPAFIESGLAATSARLEAAARHTNRVL